jgi:hypothetical protein
MRHRCIEVFVFAAASVLIATMSVAAHAGHKDRPPVVSISAPAAATVGTAVTLAATASDPDDAVAKVAFYANGVALGQDTSPPYNLSWTPVAAGSFKITAVATDTRGASTTSAAVTVSVSASANASGPIHAHNAVYLGMNYVTDYASATTLTQQFLDRAKSMYAVDTIFVNVGQVDSSGALDAPSDEAVTFLNTIAAWESANPGYPLRVLAWLNGNTDRSATNFYLDIASSATQSLVVEQAKKFVSRSYPGSHIAGALREFDGVQIDFEPAGGVNFNGVYTFMLALRSGLDSAGFGTKLTGFATPALASSASTWEWTASQFYSIGLTTSLLAPMTYDTGFSTEAQYTNWMTSQTQSILAAVSGKTWNNDASHPAPTNGVKVMFGFPAYAASSLHLPAVENSRTAANGIAAALGTIDPVSASYLQAGYMYLHTDGTGSDGFASYSSDWWMFGHYWVGAF